MKVILDVLLVLQHTMNESIFQGVHATELFTKNEQHPRSIFMIEFGICTFPDKPDAVGINADASRKHKIIQTLSPRSLDSINRQYYCPGAPPLYIGSDQNQPVVRGLRWTQGNYARRCHGERSVKGTHNKSTSIRQEEGIIISVVTISQ